MDRLWMSTSVFAFMTSVFSFIAANGPGFLMSAGLFVIAATKRTSMRMENGGASGFYRHADSDMKRCVAVTFAVLYGIGALLFLTGMVWYPFFM